MLVVAGSLMQDNENGHSSLLWLKNNRSQSATTNKQTNKTKKLQWINKASTASRREETKRGRTAGTQGVTTDTTTSDENETREENNSAGLLSHGP